LRMKLNEFEFIARLQKIVADLNSLLLPSPLPGKESVETEKLWKIRDELESLLKLVKPEYSFSDLLSDMPLILDYILRPPLFKSAVATAESDRRNGEGKENEVSSSR